MTDRKYTAAEVEALLAEYVFDTGNPFVGIARQFVEQAREIERLRAALQQFANADLREENCASFEIANKRIRHIARTALNEAMK